MIALLKTKSLLFSSGLCLLSIIILFDFNFSKVSEADLIITNIQLIDGTGNFMEHANIVIKGARIVKIVEDDSLPDAKTYIDGRGKTVIPGLIDLHQHLFAHLRLNSDSALATYIDNELQSYLNEYLKYGVTTIKSVGDYGIAILNVKKKLNEGKLNGPGLYAVGPIFTAPGGHPAGTICENNPWCRQRFAVELAKGEETKAAKLVRQWANRGVDAIKIVYDDFKGTLPKLNESVMKTIIKTSHAEGLRVTAHTTTLSDAIDAVNAGVDGLEHGVADQLVDSTFINLLLEKNIYYVPTLAAINMQTRMTPEFTKIANANFTKLLNSGVKMAAGSDFQPPGLSTLADLYQMILNGATSMQAIMAATQNAAEHLGVLDSLGTAEPGKLANLVILNGNPLKDFKVIELVELVIQRGKVIVNLQK